MRIYLLRHAIAAPRDRRRWPIDSTRPVTPLGRRRMRWAALGMRALGLRFDLVLTSPLKRARQTARLVMGAIHPKPPLRPHRPLAPGGSAAAILEGIPASLREGAILLVGHEPDLSRLMAVLVMRNSFDFPIEFKKGGLCRIDFERDPQPGTGRIVFHLMPRHLRALGRREA